MITIDDILPPNHLEPLRSIVLRPDEDVVDDDQTLNTKKTSYLLKYLRQGWKPIESLSPIAILTQHVPHWLHLLPTYSQVLENRVLVRGIEVSSDEHIPQLRPVLAEFFCDFLPDHHGPFKPRLLRFMIQMGIHKHHVKLVV